MSGRPILSVAGVSHAFGPLEVLRDISFEVAHGEVLAVLGPSGCGKSTLLAILGGLVSPDAGTVAMAPAPPGTLNPLTFVFQDFALLPWRTAAGNVAFALEHHALDARARDALVDDALARTGLSEFRDALPKTLSGGMRQRVGLARALAAKPAVLLMDEPFSALDSQTRDLMMDDLAALLGAGGLGVVYVTHAIDEALRLADRIVVLSRRPGAVRATLAIDVSREERGKPEHAAALARIRGDLWSMIREDAVAADRERENV